jgi:hypothetical protein
VAVPRTRPMSQIFAFNNPFGQAGETIEAPDKRGRRVSLALEPENMSIRERAKQKLEAITQGKQYTPPPVVDAPKQVSLVQRSVIAQYLFTYSYYLLIIAIIYFLMVGVPLWNGTAYYIW